MIRYAQTGLLPIDNTIFSEGIEKAMLPTALGKKNGMFAESKRASRRTAAIQSLFAIAKLNDIEPAA